MYLLWDNQNVLCNSDTAFLFHSNKYMKLGYIRLELCEVNLIGKLIVILIASKIYRPDRCCLSDAVFQKLMSVKCNSHLLK